MRFRFTIRDLFWLTLVAALAVGWWLDHRRMANQHELDELQLMIEKTIQIST